MIKEIRLPEISENVDSGDVIEVLVKVGDFIKAEQPVVELETEKAAFEVPSPVKGKVVEINVKEGEKIKVGQIILKVDTEAEPDKEAIAPAERKTTEKKQRPAVGVLEIADETSAAKQPEEAEKKLRAASSGLPVSPSVRQLARELGIDISKVAGTGPSGRISAEDVKRYAKSVISGLPMQPPTRESRALPDFTKWGDIERKAITITRKKIADTLSYTWSNVPQVTQYDEADITALEEFRNEYSSKVEQAGGKLTITSILLKVVASALQEFPKFNASFDPDTEELIYKKYYHISVAVDTDRGLLVPVVRDVDRKDILQLAVELTELAEKTRQRKVSPDDMVGGNFTISNLGGIGGTNFAPIIYWPQVAILGVARATRQPVYIGGKFEPRLVLPLSLSYDHRVIDGAEGLRFIRWIAEALEKPFLLAIQK